ncbi:MAG: hypothetical protein U0637_13980 [Phycisphaerales bacterium]
MSHAVRRALFIGAGVLGGVAASVGAQVNFIELFFPNNYRQTAVNAYTNLGVTGEAILLAQNAADVGDVLVSLPNFDDEFSLSTFGGGVFSGSYGSFSSQASLLNAMPSGDYTVDWSGGTLGSGSAVVSQPFTGGLWPGVFPRFSATTFNTVQGMNPAQPFTFALANSFTPAPQSETESGGFYISTVQPNTLPGAVVYSQLGADAAALPSSRVMPANTLAANTQYYVTWLFSNAIEDNPPVIGTTKVEWRTTTRLLFTTGAAPVLCDSIDYNGDGLFPDTADIDDFLSVFSGGPCSTGTCGDIDFNNDGLFPDTLDIDSLLSVFSGGPCN